jgi:RimJ/RimL family protein N-acetyltransferase
VTYTYEQDQNDAVSARSNRSFHAWSTHAFRCKIERVDQQRNQSPTRKILMQWRSTHIVSERLSIRPFGADDANDAFSCITPSLTRFLSFDPAPSPAAFETIWRGWLPKIDDGVDFTFTLRERATNAFIGLAGLHRTGDPEPELGIWVREDKHGQAYGREAVRAVAQWAAAAFEPSGFTYPVAVANRPSRRLAEALGGEVIGHRPGAKYVVYRIPA